MKQNKNLIEKLIHGDFGLAKTFWLFFVVIGFALQFALQFTLLLSIVASLVAGVLLLSYISMTLIGIWKASAKYETNKIWSLLAKIVVIFGWIYVANDFVNIAFLFI